MRTDLKNTLLATIVTALSATVAIGQAQAGKGGPPGSMGQGEAIVITLQTSPFLNAEAACVGVQIGINLLMDDVNGEDPGEVTPAESVILFPTLQGVDAVSPRMKDLTSENAPVELFCTTPGDDVLLTDLIKKFSSMDGASVIACPLCWKTRYPGEAPFVGVVGNAVSVHDLFLNADKVLSY